MRATSEPHMPPALRQAQDERFFLATVLTPFVVSLSNHERIPA